MIACHVFGNAQTYTRVLHCTPASVGLAQARPNNESLGPTLHHSQQFYMYMIYDIYTYDEQI